MDEEIKVDEVLSQVPGPQRLDPEASPHVRLHSHTDPRSVALTVLAGLAVLAVLRWASEFFIPVMLGFVFSYALTPVVDGLARLRVPRSLSAGVLIALILGGTGASVYALSDDANELINSLPQAAHKLAQVMQQRSGARVSPLENVERAAAELERATKPPPQAGAQPVVVVEKHPFNIRDHLWSGTVGLVTLLGQTVLVAFLTYFLLVAGDTFRRKLVKIAGPSMTRKKLTVEALDEIHVQIQRYLLVQILASVLVGVSTAAVFAYLGLRHAAVWGVATGVLNLVPYVGNVLVTGAAALVAFLQFGEIWPVAVVTGASLVINTLEGYLLVPWLTSRANRMNAVAVFIGVLGWGWLWGVWGLLLGIPIMMVVKAVCDRVEDFKPVGELLGT